MGVRRDLNFVRLENHTAGQFGFSAVKLKHLERRSYTLAQISVDTSASADAYRLAMEAVLRRIVSACREPNGRDAPMLRLVGFDSYPHEVHGFKPVTECDPHDYDDLFLPAGTTALYDAALDAIEAVTHFGRQLSENGYRANSLVVVVTDGMDNQSLVGPNKLKTALAEAHRRENLEGMRSTLVGICLGAADELSGKLAQFRKEAAFNDYLELRYMDEQSTTRLAESITSSIWSLAQGAGNERYMRAAKADERNLRPENWSRNS